MHIHEEIANFLIEKKITIAVAESCTGGLMSHLLAEIPGISSIFWGSVVAYSKDAKLKLVGVPEKIINKYGAVSEENAMAMATCMREKSGTDIGVGITGIAGPGGATPGKPVGIVFIAVSMEGETMVWSHKFKGSRVDIQAQSAEAAFKHILALLSNPKV